MSNEVGAVFDEFVEGGLLDDADVLVRSARFAKWDYNKTQKESLFLRTVLVTDDGKEHEEYLSAGDLRFFVPSTDGTKAIPVGAQTKMNVNSNFGAFIISLKNADTVGQAKAALSTSDNLSAVLEGMKLHVVRKAVPTRERLVAPGADIPGQAKRPQTQLVVERLISYANGQVVNTTAPATAAPPATAAAAPVPAAAAPVPQAPPAAAPPAAAAAAPAAGVSDDVTNAAIPILLDILANNGMQVAKAIIAGKVFMSETGKATPAPVRNQVLGVLVNDAWLRSPAVANNGISFDGTTIKLG